MSDSTPSTTEHGAEYVVPTTESGEVARLRELADQAEAEAERLRKMARSRQDRFWQVDKQWTAKYGPGVALLMAAIRDYTRLDYGVCFASRETLAQDLGTTPNKIKHWSSEIRGSGESRQGKGEFFYAIRPGRTTVYALSDDALRAFVEGEGRAKPVGESGENAPGVGRIGTGSRAKTHHDREQEKDNKLRRTINNNEKNVVVGSSLKVSDKALVKLEELQSPEWVERWLRIAEQGHTKGQVRKPEAWLLSFAENPWSDETPSWYVPEVADYTVGEFADFWDPPSESDERQSEAA